MPRILLLSLLLTLGKSVYATNCEEVMIPFFTEQVPIQYQTDLLQIQRPSMSEQGLRAYFRQMSTTEYEVLIRSLQQARRAFRLNDWLYYKLVKQVLRQIYGQHEPVDRTLASWFILSQSGYDTRLTYFEDKAYLYVFTMDEVFEAPIIQDRGRSFINLSEIRTGHTKQQALYMLGFSPNPDGHAFTFTFKDLPRLRPMLKSHEISFFYKKEWYTLEVEVDENIAAYMEDYPVVAETQYLEVPMSAQLFQSLIPQMKELLKGKNEWQSAELLAAFTRSAFAYKEDKAYFGYSKPMVAEEVFIHPYSDCEDRTALFFQLAKHLLPLPTLVIAYPDHLTLAMALPPAPGNTVPYQGHNYYFTDPTGPVRDHTVGKVPKGYENKPFKIIKHYHVPGVTQEK
ncbi:MAG: hypothetical protein RIC19_24335 [Phaeodactylibacter sp.]|uniref:hypothetical protein n=1 Tax=Phaeodactylibacter sp. TaxID=1940289 RepID=UPI0032EB91ED